MESNNSFFAHTATVNSPPPSALARKKPIPSAFVSSVCRLLWETRHLGTGLETGKENPKQ